MKYELYYSTGGHGGPYSSLEEAEEWAERYLNGDRRMKTVEIRPYNSKARGGFKSANPGSKYIHASVNLLANKVASGFMKKLTAGRDWVSLVIKELKELQRLGVDIPRKKMDKREIMRWFSDIDMENVGSRELSHLIDNYLEM